MAKISVNIQKAASVNAEVAHILVEVPHVHRHSVNSVEMADAIARQIPGARMLSNSLHRTEAPNMYGVFVRTARRTIPMEQASANGLSRVTDTVFQDEGDNIWAVQSDAHGAYLTQTGSEDIAGLLSAVKVRSIATASVAIELEEHFAPNQPLVYFDPVRETASFGIAVDGGRVYNPETASVHAVLPTQVLSVYDGPQPHEFASAKSDAKKAALDYYGELYGHNAEFFARIKAIINEVVA